MVIRTRTWKKNSMATGTHMKISTMDTAMPMAMATLTRASGMGILTVTTMDIHTRICTMVIAVATRTKASTTEDMDMTMNIAMEATGSLGFQASSTTWTLSPSGPMHWGPQC
jgi:hypothetical protein